MTTSELKRITIDFKEISDLLIQQRQIINQSNKIRRRLKTKLKEYSFLSEMVAINGNGNKLVSAIVDFFKALGFTNIENVDKKYKEEDIRLFVGNRLLIIEVTGIDSRNPQDAKIHQISKHIPIRQKQYPTHIVTGLFIVNHDNQKPYDNREKKPFRNALNEISSSHKYTITTTIDLLNAFILFKKGLMEPSEIIDQLILTGEMKILGT